jgi:hypothetical protein
MVKQTYKLEIKVQDYECKYNFKTEVDMKDNLTREYDEEIEYALEKLLWFSELPLSITSDPSFEYTVTILN